MWPEWGKVVLSTFKQVYLHERDRRTILERVLKKYQISIRGIGFIRLRIGIIREPL